jgi:hypothetical protein
MKIRKLIIPDRKIAKSTHGDERGNRKICQNKKTH